MVSEEYKQILFKIFELLSFSEGEKFTALETFKRKLSSEVLLSIQAELPKDQQDWLRENISSANTQEPMIAEIGKFVHDKYTKEELHEKARPLFKKVLEDYIAFMSQGLEAEKTEKLKMVVENL